MKQYRRKSIYEMDNRDIDSARAIRKQLNSSERQRGKREIRVELAEEDCNYIESSIKEYYRLGKIFTEKIADTLMRLDISVFKYSGDDYYYYYIEYDFVEQVLHPPKGWVWNGETVDRCPD